MGDIELFNFCFKFCNGALQVVYRLVLPLNLRGMCGLQLRT